MNKMRQTVFVLFIILRNAWTTYVDSIDPFAPFTTWEKSKDPTCTSFTGCLTMEDREVYLNPAAADIPCGFMAPSDLDKVRAYFLKDKVCKVVAFTAILGAYNFVHNPIIRDKNYLENDPSICLFLIVDEKTLLDGQGLGDIRPGHYNKRGRWSLINGDNTWKIILIKNLFFKSTAHTMKLIKQSAPMLFPNADYIIYVDTKYILSSNPKAMVSYFERESNGTYSIGAFAKFNHSVDLEFKGAKTRVKVQARKSGNENQWKSEVAEINRQHALYKSEGLFDIYGKENVTNLIDSAILIIKNDNRAKRFFCAWLNEVTMFSRRDQLAFYMIQFRLQTFTYQIWPKEMMGKVNHFVEDKRGNREHPPKLSWTMYNDTHPHPFKLHPSTGYT